MLVELGKAASAQGWVKWSSENKNILDDIIAKYA